MKRRQFISGVAGVTALASSVVPKAARADVPALRFRDLYESGRQLTVEADALVGQRITMTGYMAPPLKPEIHFFVLTRLPMATCPFCDDASDWPTDIVLAYVEGPFEFTRFSNLIQVEGAFEFGMHTDAETGFVSMARLVDASYIRV